MHHHPNQIPKKARPFVIVSALIQLFSLVDVLKSHNFTRGSKSLWLTAVFIAPPIGPLVYYLVGRKKHDD